MAITDTIYQSSSAADMQTVVNTYLASISNPLILDWQIQAAVISNRLGTPYRFLLTANPGAGAALATPFLLDVIEAQGTAALQTALAAYRTTYAGQFISAAKFLFIPDDNVVSSKVVAAFIRNTTSGASANYTIQS